MNFSRKITAFDEGMMVYDNLIEDESAIFVNFALGICITQRTIHEQLTEYLDDLSRDECQEIPDIDFDKMTDLDYLLKTGKLRNDMEALNGKTIREHIEENFKEYLDMKPVELQEHIYQEASWMANQLKVVYEKILHANPILFEKNFVRLLNRYDWSEVEQEHRKWKHEQSEITMEMLQEKRERALEKILRKGIFQYVPKPSANFMEKVDYQYHTKRLEFDFVDSEDYKVEFAKLMKYAVRKEELLIIDLKKYGKYIFLHFKDFREEQKLALFELVVRINLIQQDMVEKKRELGKFLGLTSDESLEGTRYFAFARSMETLLHQEWFVDLRTDKKYDLTWIKQFLNDLMHSQWRDVIIEEWEEADKRLMLKYAIVGSLKDAGVIGGSYRSIVKNMNLEEGEIDTLAKYLGYGKKLPYYDWICSYVKV